MIDELKKQTKKASSRFTNISAISDTTETLKNKVDEIDSYIINLQSERSIKIGKYKVEIESLETEIQKLIDSYEKSLMDTKNQYQLELSKYREQFKQEEDELEEKIKIASAKYEGYLVQKSEIVKTRKEAELAELKGHLQMLKLKAESRTIAADTRAEKLFSPAKMKHESDLLLKLDMLSNKIAECKEDNKQNILRSKLKIKELEFNYMKRKENNSKAIKHITKQVQVVKEDCDKSYRLAKADAEGSLQQIQIEANEALEKEKLMNNFCFQINKKYSQQINDMKKEIEKTKQAIEDSKQRIFRQAGELNEQVEKLQELQRENVHLDASIGILQNELRQLKIETDSMKKEKNQMESDVFQRSIAMFRVTNDNQNY